MTEHTPRDLSRRDLLRSAAALAASAALAGPRRARAGDSPQAPPPPSAPDLSRETLDFVLRCSRDDGGYSPSPDPSYHGDSDTRLSDLAAVTYAATLAKTLGWRLPRPDRSIEFIHRHQQPDGSFQSTGAWDPRSDLAVLYSTVQAVVALRALGARPRIDPSRTLDRFFAKDAYRKLPWYTTSFFPLFYAALGTPFPEDQDRALRDLQVRAQAEDGYLGDHVAATFHMAHYFRLRGTAHAPRGEDGRPASSATRSPTAAGTSRSPTGTSTPASTRCSSSGSSEAMRSPCGGPSPGAPTGRSAAATPTAASATSPGGPPTWTPSTSSSAPSSRRAGSRAPAWTSPTPRR